MVARDILCLCIIKQHWCLFVVTALTIFLVILSSNVIYVQRRWGVLQICEVNTIFYFVVEIFSNTPMGTLEYQIVNFIEKSG